MPYAVCFSRYAKPRLLVKENSNGWMTLKSYAVSYRLAIAAS